MKHVIIGAGAAGIAAAKTIRALRPGDEITVISADDAVHSRCMLHHYISGRRSEKSLCFAPEDFFAKSNITWLSGTAVTRINTAEKTVEAGGKIAYDNLLIAAGAASVIPPVGALRTAPNVYGLRDLADARAIAAAAKTAKNIMVIGSGLVGLDAAYALLELKKNVTVVEMADKILPLQLDANAAEAYQTLFENHGCVFRLGVGASDTVCDGKGNVTGITLATGETLPCDFVIAAAGVRPQTALFAESGIEAERAITVDSGMRTSAPGVFAAGDITGLSGIWPNAVKQGQVAAENMCGGDAVYDDTFALKNTINFFGLTTLSLGQTTPGEGEKVLVREDRKSYKKLVLDNNTIKGVLLQGDISSTGFWQYIIKNKVDISAFRDDIWRISYANFYELDEKGAYKYPVRTKA